MVDESLLVEKYDHLGAVATITETLYQAKEEEFVEDKNTLIQVQYQRITEMLYFAVHEDQKNGVLSGLVLLIGPIIDLFPLGISIRQLIFSLALIYMGVKFCRCSSEA